MKTYYSEWSKRFINDGLKAIKLIIGLGLVVGVAVSVNLPLAFMVFGYVLTDALIHKN